MRLRLSEGHLSPASGVGPMAGVVDITDELADAEKAAGKDDH
jgi:hypothetical protein